MPQSERFCYNFGFFLIFVIKKIAKEKEEIEIKECVASVNV